MHVFCYTFANNTYAQSTYDENIANVTKNKKQQQKKVCFPLTQNDCVMKMKQSVNVIVRRMSALTMES